MAYDTHSIFAYSSVSSITSQSGTTLVIVLPTGDGALFHIGQQVCLSPVNTLALLSNSMIGRLTGISGDTLTIDYGVSNREGSNVRTVLVGDTVSNPITPKVLTDIENNKVFTPGEFDNGSQKGTYNIDWSKGDRQKVTCDHTGNLTLTYSNAVQGQTLTLRVLEDGTGGSTITLPTSMWPNNGTVVAFTTTASAINLLIVYFDGTNYLTQLSPGFA